MATDQQVTARAVLRAVAELERQGPGPAMRLLEQTEPDLAEYVMETLSLIHRRLLALGGNAAQSRRVYRQVQGLVLVSVGSLRHAHHQLWREQMAEGLAQLEPGAEASEPTPPTLPEE